MKSGCFDHKISALQMLQHKTQGKNDCEREKNTNSIEHIHLSDRILSSFFLQNVRSIVLIYVHQFRGL